MTARTNAADAMREELNDQFDKVAHQLDDALVLARSFLALVEQVEASMVERHAPTSGINLAIDLGRMAAGAVDRAGVAFEGLQIDVVNRFAPRQEDTRPRPTPLMVV